MEKEHLFPGAKRERGKMDAGIEFTNVYDRRRFNKNRGDFC